MFIIKYKKVKLAILLTVSAGMVFADRIHFSYDNTGNRTGASLSSGTRSSFENGLEAADTMALSNIYAYPNPTDGPFTVNIAGYNLENAIITVIDMFGKCIINMTDISESNAMDLTGYPSGIYLLKIQIGYYKESVHKIIRL